MSGETHQMAVKWEHWLEWKQYCAKALCCPAAQGELTAFARKRYERHMQGWQCAEHLDPDACWHLLESHLQWSGAPAGKTWKNWLFSRCKDNDLHRGVESGASLIMRDATRRFLRSEATRRKQRSLDDDTLDRALQRNETMAEILLRKAASPADELEVSEQQQLARVEAEQFARELSERESFVLLARSEHMSLKSLPLQDLLQRRTSNLYELWNRLLLKLNGHLEKRYPDEGRGLLIQTYIALMDLLQQDKGEQFRQQLAQNAHKQVIYVEC